MITIFRLVVLVALAAVLTVRFLVVVVVVFCLSDHSSFLIILSTLIHTIYQASSSCSRAGTHSCEPQGLSSETKDILGVVLERVSAGATSTVSFGSTKRARLTVSAYCAPSAHGFECLSKWCCLTVP